MNPLILNKFFPAGILCMLAFSSLVAQTTLYFPVAGVSFPIFRSEYLYSLDLSNGKIDTVYKHPISLTIGICSDDGSEVLFIQNKYIIFSDSTFLLDVKSHTILWKNSLEVTGLFSSYYHCLSKKFLVVRNEQNTYTFITLDEKTG